MKQHIIKCDEKATSFLVSNIRTSLDASSDEVCILARKKLASLHIAPQNAEYVIYRKSVDARKKNEIRLVWTVQVSASFSQKETERMEKSGIRRAVSSSFTVKTGSQKLPDRLIVVGSGPAGLFCAYLLAENGYCPLLIERGGSIEERVKSVDRFLQEQILDPNTNIQFGAGGAGTFSDGKLLTRTNDPYIPYILDTFVKFGAPREILTQAKPHIGTDILRSVIDRMTAQIAKMGGEVVYHTQLTDIKESTPHGGIIETSTGAIPYGVLVLAIGHSARDTYAMLMRRQFAVSPKPFSVGVRAEHLQQDIDAALYGNFAGHPALGHAEYGLSCNTDTRGVYTFCMCPGGVVVPAASECETVVVNGMSYHARDGKNANSAVVVSIRPEDYGNTSEKAIQFQREIEKRAFLAGGSTYAAPVITVGDFLNGQCKTAPSRITPTYMNGMKYKLSSPDAYLPSFVCASLRDALVQFDRQIKGFAAEDAVLTGPETRTSSPVRIMRTDDKSAVGFPTVYPCGEGAGYAGGITSAAADGIRCAIAIMEKYSPLR